MRRAAWRGARCPGLCGSGACVSARLVPARASGLLGPGRPLGPARRLARIGLLRPVRGPTPIRRREDRDRHVGPDPEAAPARHGLEQPSDQLHLLLSSRMTTCCISCSTSFRSHPVASGAGWLTPSPEEAVTSSDARREARGLAGTRVSGCPPLRAPAGRHATADGGLPNIRSD